MPTGHLATRSDVYAYPLKTNADIRRRATEVSKLTGLSLNAIFNILLDEALTARGLPKDS